ncbi:hypothetical protein CMU19_07255 [Elizabethkingia anophelis]|nr:hypothetical protein [Elizabethkingia anophelis]
MKPLSYKYQKAVLINEIINRNFNNQFGVITMNNIYVVWAFKKGYVRIQSATQQEWTEEGVKWVNALKQ